jgi:hypothetical protein
VIGKVLTLNGDKDYSAFCQKILLVYNFIHEKTGKRPSLREIDTFLVYIANNKLNRNKNNK